MRDIRTRAEIIPSWEELSTIFYTYARITTDGNLITPITGLEEVFKNGIRFADDCPNWIPCDKQMPTNGDRILLYLDTDTIQAHTYHDKDKELMRLFKLHVIAWMYQPNKPIFKNE